MSATFSVFVFGWRILYSGRQMFWARWQLDKQRKYEYWFFYKNNVLLILTVSLHLPNQFAKKQSLEASKYVKAQALVIRNAKLKSFVLLKINVNQGKSPRVILIPRPPINNNNRYRRIQWFLWKKYVFCSDTDGVNKLSFPNVEPKKSSKLKPYILNILPWIILIALIL